MNDGMMEFSHANFLNLDSSASDPKRSGVVVLPLPLDVTASWKRGTAEGPDAIIAASHHLEMYDDELRIDPCSAVGGIATHLAPELPTDPTLATQQIHALAVEMVRQDRLLISLGGEHSITYPLVRAHRGTWPDLSVVQIDAHADMRTSYKDTTYNHACPMRRIMELGVHVTSVGVRSLDASESSFILSENSRIFFATDVAGRLESWCEAIIDSLPSDDVYLTIDLDGFDPSVIPAVGTPVPGGLGWYETLAFIRRLSEERRIVGADVVELAPRPGLHYADAAAARLVYKLAAYWAFARQ
jgi:agmatinase